MIKEINDGQWKYEVDISHKWANVYIVKFVLDRYIHDGEILGSRVTQMGGYTGFKCRTESEAIDCHYYLGEGSGDEFELQKSRYNPAE